MRFEDDVRKRLIRLESRMVRGFEELGVNTDQDDDWLTVDNANHTVYVSTIGRSMLVLLQDMARKGATDEGYMYEIIHQGRTIGNVTYNPVFK